MFRQLVNRQARLEPGKSSYRACPLNHITVFPYRNSQTVLMVSEYTVTYPASLTGNAMQKLNASRLESGSLIVWCMDLWQSLKNLDPEPKATSIGCQPYVNFEYTSSRFVKQNLII